jgi:hypothetical protein
MTMTSYGSEELAYPLRDSRVTDRLGIIRRFDGPVCGALSTEREARGRKDFSILAEEKRVQSEEGSKNTERDSGNGRCPNVACQISKSMMARAKLNCC